MFRNLRHKCRGLCELVEAVEHFGAGLDRIDHHIEVTPLPQTEMMP